MPLADSEETLRVYEGFSRALLSVSPVGVLAPARGADAKIDAGLAVYRNNVRAAYLRVLGEAFPVVARLVDDGFFRYAAHEYFHAYPPHTPLVARYGDSFPAFLEGFEPASGLPYLADVARIEIAWLEAYHAPEATPRTAEEISSCIGESPDKAKFVFHPSLRILSSPHPAYSIWRHNHDRRDSALTPPAGGERVFIARPETEVIVMPLDIATYVALQALAAGARLGGAIESALDERPSASVSDIVNQIVTSGVIVSATLN